jgi:tetratricopeptide (TPR) repeat protein
MWQEAADKWGINVLLIPEAEPEAEATIRQDAMRYCRSENWRPVYMDEVSLVLLRNIPANQPWISRLQIDCSKQEFVPPPPSASRKDLYDFFINAAGILSVLNRDHESEAAMIRASALYPEDPNARWMLGQLYQRHMLFDRAESEYRASLALNETDGAWIELGLLFIQEKRLPEAEHAFSRAIQLSEDPFDLYRELAQVELSMQHPDAALRAFDGATSSSPYRNGGESQAPQVYAEIADGRAQAYRMLSNLPEAIKSEQEAVRLTPRVAERWNMLADLLEAAGQPELSRQSHQRALEFAAGQH